MATRNWTGSYENSPGDSDAVSQGATRIREGRLDNRERATTEHQWDDGSVGGKPNEAGPPAGNNSGRHREGSGRAFVTAGGEPATLGNTDANGVNTLDQGRVNFQSDDDYLLKVYDGGWQDAKVAKAATIESDDVDLTTTAPTTGDILQYNGSQWIPVSPEVRSATVTAPQTITRGAGWTVVTGLTATVVVPATGRYYIKVMAKASGQIPTTGGKGIVQEVQAKLILTKDADPAVDVDFSGNAAYQNTTNYQSQNSMSLHSVVVPADSGSTYVYTVQAQAFDLPIAGQGSHWEAQGGDHQSQIIVELIPFNNP